MKTLEERVTELEIHYTHQVRMVEELNEVLADCSLRIDRLLQENRAMREMLKTLAPELMESPDE